jgi:hypothetical protein
MLSRSQIETWDEPDETDPDSFAGLAALHGAYLASIREHRALMADLGATLARLGDAIAAATIAAEERSSLMAGIDLHADRARAIVASIDRALTLAAVTRPAGQH